MGAVIGGIGNFTFGRDVVKAARIAFPTPPTDFPDVLRDFEKADPDVTAQSRAVKALQSAAGTASGLGVAARDIAGGAVGAVRSRFTRKGSDDGATA